MISSHSLISNVIYDSRCSQTLIFDKNRFIDDIDLANNFIISDDYIKIARCETILINAQLRKKDVSLRFYRMTYKFINTITSMSQSKLAKRKFDWDLYTKNWSHLNTSKQIFEIQKHYKLLLLQYKLTR